LESPPNITPAANGAKTGIAAYFHSAVVLFLNGVK